MTREETPGRPGVLQLADGAEFAGRLVGRGDEAAGEVVFNTGMVGYLESLTDPSYRGQILAFTYPLIGNYGVPSIKDDPWAFESGGLQPRAVVVSRLAREWSHHRAATGLEAWLIEQGGMGLEGVDVRRLTKHLRGAGTLPGRIVPVERREEPFTPAPAPGSREVAQVSPAAPVRVAAAGKERGRLTLVDCGCKESILRRLTERGLRLRRVPWNDPLAEVEPGGVLIGNGPGDPAALEETIAAVARLMARPAPPPLFGICLGAQIMALAAGGETYKLPFGHRSQNQPCRPAGEGRCLVTSQNHGYAVREESLPEGWEVWYRNLNDGSVEGIRHRERPWFAVQFHPEAAPGPTDADPFFDLVLEAVRRG